MKRTEHPLLLALADLRCWALFLLFSGLFTHQVLGQVCASNDPSLLGIVPVLEAFPGGNPVCGSVSGNRLTPGDGAETITFNLDGITGNDVTVIITIDPDCGEVLAWSVPDHIVIDKVFAKGGPDQNVYDYTGTNPRATSDGNLHSPVNASGKYAAFSHIDFCFHYKLDVAKTAEATFTRTYDWQIDKQCLGEASLTLATGQAYGYPFSWTADVAGTTDSDWKVEGTITIENNTPFAATITSVTDVLTGGINATADCGVTFPHVLASGATLNCSYTADLPGADDGTNTVTVVTSTAKVEGGTATADYVFGDPTLLVDECVDVADDCSSGTTQVCYGDAPFTQEYTCSVGSYDVCGSYTHTNTASFTTNDQGSTGSDACTVSVEVPCVGGCTLTQGYWKTHSEFGPAPYDDTWALLPSGASTPFFLSGKTYYQVLWTPPAGNAYYNLAHQYIAAELNFLNGADPSAAQVAFNTATTLLTTYTPAQIGALRGNNPLRHQFTSLAGILDDYNNGEIGPGHCDEDDNSSAGSTNRIATSSSDLSEGGLALGQNMPNPFDASTQFTFTLSRDTHVKITVFNLNGQAMATVVKDYFDAGMYTIDWTAPAMLPAGIYLYRLETADVVITKKMTLIR